MQAMGKSSKLNRQLAEASSLGSGRLEFDYSPNCLGLRRVELKNLRLHGSMEFGFPDWREFHLGVPMVARLPYLGQHCLSRVKVCQAKSRLVHFRLAFFERQPIRQRHRLLRQAA